MRRQQLLRKRRRRLVVAAGIAAVLLVATGSWLAFTGGSEGAAGSRVTAGAGARRVRLPAEPSTTAAPVTTTTTAVASTAPYAVGVTQLTVEDASRPTAARGDTPASNTRRLGLTIRYPIAGAAGSGEAAGAPVASGTFPLVVFAHGFAVSAATYQALEHDLATGGFIVVAPDFPISSAALPGPASESDISNQAHDVSFLITQFQGASVPALFAGHVAAGKAGVVGHSDGGTTAAEVAGDSCCADPRIGAAAVLSGDEGHDPGTWFASGNPPMLFVQGTADDINPYSFSQKLYDDAKSPKTLVNILGAGHLDPYTTGSQRPVIDALVVDFLRAKLDNDGAASAQIVADENVAGVLQLAASA